MRRCQANPGCVLFIDELHSLLGNYALKLYLLLEEGRYQFHGEPAPVSVGPVTLLGATTDYGAMHAALRRRWIQHVLRPATPEQLVRYVHNRGITTEDASCLITSRSHHSGAPWEGIQLAQMAASIAAGHGRGVATEEDVQRVFELHEIDEQGLRWMDRAVIKALLGQPRYRNVKGGGRELVCHAASESNTAQIARVDKAEYRESIRPRLMSRGLLEIRPTYGQALTPKAEQIYLGCHRGGAPSESHRSAV